jgi:hypothetical protein
MMKVLGLAMIVFGIAWVGLLAGAEPPPAQPAVDGNAAESSDAIETRVYDVRNLVLPIKTFETPPVWTPAQTAPRDEAAESDEAAAIAAKLTQEVIKTIQEKVDPQSWQGPDAAGKMSELNGNLVITQTPKNQERLKSLLQQLHDGRSLQVHAKSQFIVMPAEQDRALLKWLGANVKAQFDEKTGTMPLDADQAAALVKEAQGTPGVQVVAAPGLTQFSGHGAYTAVVTEQALAVSLLDKQGKVVVTFREGATVDVEPTVSADKEHVNLTVQPKFTKLLSQDALPRFSQASADLSISMPDKGALLIRVPFVEQKVRGAVEKTPEKGPKTIEVVSAPANPGATPQEYLYFLIEPTIIFEQRNVDRPEAP